ncbi:periplasmic heavy metal sensor [Maricaulis maris]|uniref:periplasmic heavy metal sensor n=1 Tax=Maricaulis maris TaxID=74318 RepID=UPI0026F03872|nr:periplasmic heavy metal sensor [Maricaulis maris]
MRPALPWIIALVGSVLINGALAGYVVHRTADGPRWQMPSPETREVGRRAGPGSRQGFDLRSFVDALPDEARAEARARLRDAFLDMRGPGRDAMDVRRELDALLVAEEFDAEAVADAMARMHASQRAIEMQIETIVLDVVAGLDAETRAAALQAGRERIGRRGPPRDRRREGPPPPRQ